MSRKPCRAARLQRWLGAAALAVGFTLGPATAAPQDTPAPADAPDLQIETFVPQRAYAVGMDRIVMMAVVRNNGKAPLPAGAASLRLYCLAGLDYTEGDTAPRLPEIAPGAAASFRWTVQPTSTENALVAALALEKPGGASTVRVAAIQHISDAPGSDSAAVPREPTARAGRDYGILENNRIRARLVLSASNVPILLLSVHTPGGWRRVGASLPVAEVLSAEGGQEPWWEAFKGDEFQPATRKGEASLVLSGGCGLRWRASLELTARADSGILDVRLKLSALRPLRLHGLRFCPFLAGDGSFGSASSETLGPEPTATNMVCAVRWGEITTGVLRPDTAPIAGWSWQPLPTTDSADYRLMATEMRAGNTASTAEAGALIVLRARLFALTPSRSASDARRIALPAR